MAQNKNQTPTPEIDPKAALSHEDSLVIVDKLRELSEANQSLSEQVASLQRQSDALAGENKNILEQLRELSEANQSLKATSKSLATDEATQKPASPKAPERKPFPADNKGKVKLRNSKYDNVEEVKVNTAEGEIVFRKGVAELDYERAQLLHAQFMNLEVVE